MLQSSINNGPSLSSRPIERPARTDSRARSTSPLKCFASTTPSKPLNAPDAQRAWTASYLTDLRSNRPARPSGSRPLPNRHSTASPIPVLEPTLRPTSALSLSRPSCSVQQPDLASPKDLSRSASTMSHSRAQSDIPHGKSASEASRPIAQQPYCGVTSRDFSTSTTTSSKSPARGAYLERGQRWMERQEARSLREALEDMDARDDARLHAAAQQEASELVWMHRNMDTPSVVRDRSYNYKRHLQEGSHARSQSLAYASLGVGKGFPMSNQRSASDGSSSNKSQSSKSQGSRSSSSASNEEAKTSRAQVSPAATPGHSLWDSPQRKAYMNLSFPIPPIRPLGRRKASGPKSRKSSGGLFSNPSDKIYEEPDEVEKTTHDVLPATESRQDPVALKLKTRNSIAKLQSGGHGFLRGKANPDISDKAISRTEIHRNPPSQSRNPSYLQNESSKVEPKDSFNRFTGSSKDGIEIRGDDIKSATSMRMKDRSPKLPSPTFVSNKPGRPIVSFDKDWRPKRTESKEVSSRASIREGPRPLPSTTSKPPILGSTASAPAIPTINVPDPPSISIDEAPAATSINVFSLPPQSIRTPAIPIISAPEEPPTLRFPPSTHSDHRPGPLRRPLPPHSSTAPTNTSLPHWSPSSHNRPTAQCTACALPIAGRIVSAASQRFHPHCFTCFHCSELLECVAFYPEPSISRDARLARIESRTSNPTAADIIDGHSSMEDGDSGLRFYCHLDYHEIFSPRCRSCKTPIEGEVVLACGGEWHKGHFFCAECGDPFDEQTPFVERNGYAWCVGCHAGKFNGKCIGCRKVILEQGVQALGGEWHEACFCCNECGGPFEDGRFFTRGNEEKPFCVQCEERRLKA